ncbi:hypothetical protein [Flammeovirga pacifica]|nr:hypothetical protein [Flammeovirga pacifica]
MVDFDEKASAWQDDFKPKFAPGEDKKEDDDDLEIEIDLEMD